ncbi:MAG: hypothetical protein AAF732_21920 [Pseudomonadota bacterium]
MVRLSSGSRHGTHRDAGEHHYIGSSRGPRRLSTAEGSPNVEQRHRLANLPDRDMSASLTKLPTGGAMRGAPSGYTWRS